MLLLSLNGFSEQQATSGIVLYIVLGLANAIGLGVAGAFVAKRLAAKPSLGSVGASAIAIVGFSVVGALIIFVGFIAAVLLATLMHEWR